MIHNEIRAYLHELETLADTVREHLELSGEYQLHKHAQGQLRMRLDRVAAAKRELAKVATEASDR
jgi:hypothetical protein